MTLLTPSVLMNSIPHPTCSIHKQIAESCLCPRIGSHPHSSDNGWLILVMLQVLQISGTDADGDDLSYTMLTETAGDAASYFYVDSRTGSVILRRQLPADYSRDFEFQVRVSDGGQPERSYITRITGECGESR